MWVARIRCGVGLVRGGCSHSSWMILTLEAIAVLNDEETHFSPVKIRSPVPLTTCGRVYAFRSK